MGSLAAYLQESFIRSFPKDLDLRGKSRFSIRSAKLFGYPPRPTSSCSAWMERESSG